MIRNTPKETGKGEKMKIRLIHKLIYERNIALIGLVISFITLITYGFCTNNPFVYLVGTFNVFTIIAMTSH